MDRYGHSYSSDSDEHSPVMWLRGHPVYGAHFIVLVYVVSMLVTTLLRIFRIDGPMMEWLPFASDLVLHGQVWRIATYGLVNLPSLWFAVDMLMLVWFGREVERYFGRRTFFWFFGSAYLLTPVLFTLIGPWFPLSLVGQTGSFAVFIAFATIYPGALMMFNLLAKWVAIVLVAIQTLVALSEHNWTMLISLWATCGFAFAFVKYHQGEWQLPKFKFAQRKPKLRVLPDLPAKTAKKSAPTSAAAAPNSAAEVDALLDKIAQSGYASLTAKERAILESRSQSLKKNSARD